jgi:phage-related protein
MAGQTVVVSVLSDMKDFTKGMNDVADRASSTFKKIGAVAAVGLLAAGAAVVGLTKSVVNAYAEYEQNIGGIETMFGKSAGKMEAYAANAYKTAGLSANEYMSQATSFSAALLKGLGGDTSKAADVANRAMTDMSDNANKFGTNIGLVQNAYQGFAKQNYTMLDNLKLGYGGTKAEMARLINDSGVLGDKMTVTAKTLDTVSYDKIIEAVGVTQDRMGITGTTAKEAASTITGSIGMLQGSWANLLVGMGDSSSDITKLVQNVGDSITAVVTNITPVVQQVMNTLPKVLAMLVPLILKLVPDLLQAGIKMITALVSGVVATLPSLIAQVVPMLLQFVEGILNQLPMILDAGIKMLLELANGITKAIPKLIPVAVNTVLRLVDTIVDNLPKIIETAITLIVTLALALIKALPKLSAKVPQIVIKIVDTLLANIDKIIDAGVKLLIALVENLPTIIKTIVGAVPKIVKGLVDAFQNNWPKIKAAGEDLLNGLWNGIKDKWEDVADWFDGISSKVRGFFKSAGGWLTSAGRNVVEGLWQGISNGYGWIKNKIESWVGNVLDFIKRLFGIKSPSTVMAGMGDYMVQGLAIGITDNIDVATRAMDKLGGSLKLKNDLALDTIKLGGTVNQYYIDGVQIDLTAEEEGEFQKWAKTIKRKARVGV